MKGNHYLCGTNTLNKIEVKNIFALSLFISGLHALPVYAQVLSVGDVILQQDFREMMMRIPSDLQNVHDSISEGSYIDDGHAKLVYRSWYSIEGIPLHNVTKISISWTYDHNYDMYDDNPIYLTYLYVSYDRSDFNSVYSFSFTQLYAQPHSTQDLVCPKLNSTLGVKFSRMRKIGNAHYLDDIVITAVEVDKSYTRDVTAGSLGSVCLPMAVEDVSESGATFYQIAGLRGEGEEQSIVFNEVSQLEAGMPYLFLAESTELTLQMCGDGVKNPKHCNGLYGVFDRYAFADDDQFVEGDYYIVNSKNQIQKASQKSGVVANRAFVKLPEVPLYDASNHAPGSRLLVLNADGFTAEEVEPTGLESIETPSLSECYSLLGLPVRSRSGLTIRHGRVTFVQP